MTRAETVAYNRGIRDTLAILRKSADAITARKCRPLAEGFAVEALTAFAEAGEDLLLPVPNPDGAKP